MNSLKIYPKFIREKYTKNMANAGIKDAQDYHSKLIIINLVVSLVISCAYFIWQTNPFFLFFSSFIIIEIYFYLRLSLKASARLKKIESIFPDVIQMMASNLRAGMTIDKSFLLSARPEFYPLDEEILKAGKEITTGKDLSTAMMGLAKRIGSEKITKTMILIMSGIKAGGDISVLLEQTSSNMREREFLEKKASSNVLMYVIFIFFAVGVGAPILFGLSSVLVEVIINIVRSLPATSASSMNMPFTFRDIGLSPLFLRYFALVFLLATDLISSMVIGLVNAGEEKSGLKYFIPLSSVSIAIFFGIRLTIGKAIIGSFSIIPR